MKLEQLLILIIENPVQTMIFVLTVMMWFCIFDRIFLYSSLLRRGRMNEFVSEKLKGLAYIKESYVDIELAGIRRKLNRNMSMIKISVALAPMLGLLGTVWGMLITFNVISDSGTGEPALMAEGISKAMNSTRLGLITAVSGVVLIPVLERMKLKLMNSLSRERSRVLQGDV